MMALFFALACAVPALPMDEETFNTSVAQTVMAALTEKYISPTLTSSPTSTFTPSVTPTLPTETPTLEATITPTFTITPTPSATFVIPPNKLIVTVNTNCRSGPDKSFPAEGTLLKGESAAVFGIDSSGRYFYISNPDPGVAYCWISGKYAVVSGSVSLVPVFTPMPTYTATPTATVAPEFNLIYADLQSCGSWWINMEVVNRGKISFKSVLFKITDAFTEKTLTTGSNDFESTFGCDTNKVIVDVLDPGSSAIVSSPSMKVDPTGSKVVIVISVCTEEGGEGTCLTKTVTFKPY